MYYKMNFNSHTYKSKVIGFSYSQKILRGIFSIISVLPWVQAMEGLWKTVYLVLA